MGIKVLHLIDSGGLYGAEIMLLTLVEAQIKSGLRPVILSAGTPGIEEKALEAEARKRNLPVKVVRMKAGINLLKAWKILSYAKKEGFDVLHSHGYKFNILIGMFPCFVRRIPLMATLHGYTYANGFSLIQLYQRVERKMLEYIDGIVFVSDKIKNNPMLEGFSKQKEKTIFNGIDAEKVIQSSNDPSAVKLSDIFHDYTEDNIYIGAVGRMSEEKGFDLLIDAFMLLADRFPRLHLVIVGEGPLRRKLEEKVICAGIGDRVKMPGFIRPVYAILKGLDGLVISSYTEGLPITLLESCILNLKIVATDVGSISAVLDGYKGCSIVEAGNVEMLADSISDLIINNSNADSNEGWDAERFSAQTMCNEYTSFYKELLT